MTHPIEGGLSELISSLEAASEGSWELDEAITRAVLDAFLPAGMSRLSRAHPVTTSIDAAVALIERKLPGWEWHALVNATHCDGEGCSYAALTPPSGARGPAVALRGKRGPIALCIALLKALQDQQVTS